MGNDTERIRKWRERKKAEGKRSFTVVLSDEAQKVLVSEKNKTGSSYSAVVEKALLGLVKPVYKPIKTRHLSNTEVFDSKVTRNVTSNGQYVKKIPVIIDDTENYTISTPYYIKSEEGWLSRIIRSSKERVFPKKKRIR
ncbi:MAG TPA: hypothetical protein PLR20_11950 [Syntrophales bacterium]|nr:hypothetical protein [Syntrophales bacterium]HPI57145.1 hypothetical protein [Syntrophales bacterium]HPN24768.1 hypothetical protein [Syntrophales bacterium]HQM30053.1 hypothetical protein [Syntrophales bacterium]